MDDIVEVEVLQSVLSTHSELLVAMTTSIWSRFQLVLDSILLFIQIHLLQPQAAALLVFLCLLALLLNDQCLERLSSLVHWLRLRVAGRGVQDVTEALCGPTPPLEWRGRRAAAFAIQGQRSSMEDRFDAEEEIATVGSVRDGRNFSIYGVYDGHGGDFAAEYTKKHLVAAIKRKLHEVRARRRPAFPSDGESDGDDAADGPTISTAYRSSLTRRPSSSSQLTATPPGSADGRPITIPVVVESQSSSRLATEAIKSATSSMKKSASASVIVSARSSDNPAGVVVTTLSPTPSSGRAGDSLLNPASASQRSLSSKSHEAYRRSPRACRADEPRAEKLVSMMGEVNYSRLMQDVFAEVDAALLDSARQQACIAGTTAVVALVDGDQVVVASCGDSRAVLCDARGNAVSLSTDHKPEQVSEKKRITEAGGFVTFNGVWRVNGVLATSRALGDLPFKERRLLTCRPDVQTVSVRHHAAPFLILASDGLWDVASPQEAVQHVRARLHEAELGARSLTLLAYQRGSQDNITVLVVDLRLGQLVPRAGSFSRRGAAAAATSS